MKLDTAEISSIIKEQIKGFEASASDANIGQIISVADGVALVHGLSGAMAGEMLEFPGDTIGMVLNLEEDCVGAVIFGPCEHLREGDQVKCTGNIFQVPVGPGLKGRVVNPIGQPIDGKSGSSRRPPKTRTKASAAIVAPAVASATDGQASAEPIRRATARAAASFAGCST